MSSRSFADLGLSPKVVSDLRAQGIADPFPIQSLVIPDALVGRDVIAESPTGSGKTVAFAAPLVERLDPSVRAPSALVLAPTRELVCQIVEETKLIARSRALSVVAVYGGVSIDRQIRALRRGQIVVATPGRLEDLLARRALRLDRIRILVLDEADRMLDMGFRPPVDRIVAQTSTDRQTLFFSATLSGDAGRVAVKYTKSARRHEHSGVNERTLDIEHRFVRLRHDAKIDALVTELRDEERGQTIVFVRTKRGAERLGKRLRSHRVDSVTIHGDKTQGQRQRALDRFRSGDVDTLVATDVAARGIDVIGVTHVINFDAPPDRDGYVHRIGRTGRAGRSGIGVTFVLDDQAADMGRIAKDLNLNREFQSAFARSSGTRGDTRSAGKGRQSFGRKRHSGHTDTKTAGSSRGHRRSRRQDAG